MDEGATKELPLRRVGLVEGLQHMAGASALWVVAALPFQGWVAAGGLLGGALLWAVGYTVFRLARLRVWFGAWDVPSFIFVWSYAAVLALAIEVIRSRWG